MELKITPNHYLALAKKAYSLDMIFLLKLIEEDYDIKPLVLGSKRIENVYHGLIRKLLLTDEGKLNLESKNLLKFISSEDNIILTKRVSHDDSFDEWWKIYPGTDGFTHRNRTFSLTRNLRGDKTRARRCWKAVLDKGEYTSEEIINATKFDIAQRKEMSVKNGKNQLTYMQNSATYIYQGTFAAFIEHMRESGVVKHTSSRAKEIDI